MKSVLHSHPVVLVIDDNQSLHEAISLLGGHEGLDHLDREISGCEAAMA